MLESIQANNCLQLSRTVARIQDDDHGIKTILAESNESYWSLTSGPGTNKHRDECRCSMTKIPQPHSVRGKRKRSAVHSSKLEAEAALFNFRHKLESKKGKQLVNKKINNVLMKDNLVECITACE